MFSTRDFFLAAVATCKNDVSYLVRLLIGPALSYGSVASMCAAFCYG